MRCLMAMVLFAQPQLPQKPEPLQLETNVSRAQVAPGAELKVAVELKIATGWHLGAHEVGESQIATKLSFTAPEGIAVVDFTYPPGIEITYVGAKVLAYAGSVLMGALLRIDAKVKPGTYTIKGELEYQACNDQGQCLMPAKRAVPITVVVAANPEVGEQKSELFARLAFKPKFVRGEVIRYRAFAAPPTLKAGATGEVVVEVAVDAGWHLYGLQSKAGFATRLKLLDAVGIEAAGEPTEPKPVEHRNDVLEETELTHEGTVAFHLPIRVKADAAPGAATIKVELHYQVCDAARCLMPKKLVLEAPVTISAAQ